MMDLEARIVEALDLEALEPAADDWPRVEVAPIRGPMRVRTYVSPDCSYASIRELLSTANDEILLYIYNVSASHMLALLEAALGRDVRVRIMYDKTDTRGDEVAKLRALPGAVLREAPSTGDRRAFTVCHQKYCVVDRRHVVVESANWAGTSIPKIEHPGAQWRKGNREWFVQLASEDAADLFARLFDLDWAYKPGVEAVAPIEGVMVERGLAFRSEVEAAPARTFEARDFAIDAEVEILPILSPQNYLEHILPLLQGAQESVCVEQQYIKGSNEDGHVAPLVAALADLPGSVDVRIVSSSVYDKSWEETIETLERYGLDDRLRAINLDTFKHCHNKGLIVDGRVVLVSSTNWSDNSIGAAREAGVLIRDPRVAGYYQEVFNLDWETGWDPSELASEMARLEALEAIGIQEEDEIHPADLV